MWFDQIDPRDPIQFTDGCGAPWDATISSTTPISGCGAVWQQQPQRLGHCQNQQKRQPDSGAGRIPSPQRRSGLSFHHRQATPQAGRRRSRLRQPRNPDRAGRQTRPCRGLLGRSLLGYTTAKTWKIHQPGTDQCRVDYTFGIGNGLYAIFEQLLVSYGEEAFSFFNTTALSLVSSPTPAYVRQPGGDPLHRLE